jgi:hypothetical protein
MTPDPLLEANYKILPATLFVSDQLVAIGRARIEAENHNGVFWPTDLTLLGTSYPHATLRFQGIKHDIPVMGVKKCRADLAAHWDFQLPN